MPFRQSDRLAPEEWRFVERVFENASELPAAARAAFLDRVCRRGSRARTAVESLLAASDTGGTGSVDAATGHRPPGMPSRIGRYRILGLIGEGGTSRVYLGRRDDVAQRVAIKVLGRLSDPAGRRFEREMKILARLEHPHIARFIDSGTTVEGSPYAVLEYVEGVPLTRYCDACRLSVEERLRLFSKICAAVQHAHQHLVIHRDLKPQNILVDDTGEPRLLDFGIARQLADLEDGTITAERLLTPSYASPEQIAGRPLNLTTDIYSLGVVLYEVLTGRLPRAAGGRSFAPGTAAPEDEPVAPSAACVAGGDSGANSAVAAARGTTPQRLRRRLHGDLDTILLKSLRFEPAERYASVEQLAEDLRRHLEGQPIRARPPSPAYLLTRFLHRHRLTAAAVTLALIVLVSWSLESIVHAQRLAEERDLARQAQLEAEQITLFLTDTFRLTDPYQRADLGVRSDDGPSVHGLLRSSAARVESGFAAQPLLRARLLDTLGEVHIHQGLIEDGLGLLERALQIRRQELGDHHPLVASSLVHLAEALMDDGRFTDAEPLLNEALILARQADEAATLARCEAGLGVLAIHRGDFIAAEAGLRSSIERQHAEPGSPRLLARALTSLGRVLLLRKDLNAAEEALREALSILVLLAGEEHPDVATAQHHLGWVLVGRDRHAEARGLFEAAWRTRRKIQGPQHPETLAAQGALGDFHFFTGDHAAAEAILRQTLEMDRRTKGPEHPDVAIDLHSLALTVWERGDLEAAEDLLRQAIEVASTAWGAGSRHVFSYQHSLAELLLARGDLAAAEPLLARVIAARSALLGADHRAVGMSSTVLADLLLQDGRTAEALQQAERATATLTAALPAGDWRIGVARSILGACLAAEGRLGEAESHLREGLALIEAGRGPHSRFARAARERVG